MAKAKRLSAHHIETSAKTGLNVRQLFTRLAQTLPGAEGSGIPDNANAAHQQSQRKHTWSYFISFCFLVIDVTLGHGTSKVSVLGGASRCGC